MKFGPPSLSSTRRTIIKWSVLAVTIALAVTIDLVTKSLAEQHLAMGEVRGFLPFLDLQRTANPGVAFGLFGGATAFIIPANIIALVIVAVYVAVERRPLLAGISGGLIIGGSLGNLVQRVTGDGRVTDFLKLPSWPNYNMADVFLVVGICAIVLGLLIETVRVWKAGRAQTPASR
jgi:signal peptidase II